MDLDECDISKPLLDHPINDAVAGIYENASEPECFICWAFSLFIYLDVFI